MDKAIELRAMCGRFRILVIGRANAGKTTILKKICESIDEPIIYDREGAEVRKVQSALPTYCWSLAFLFLLRPDWYLARKPICQCEPSVAVLSYLLRTQYFISVDSMTSTMKWCLRAIQTSCSMTRAGSSLDLLANLRLLSPLLANEPRLRLWVINYMLSGMAV